MLNGDMIEQKIDQKDMLYCCINQTTTTGGSKLLLKAIFHYMSVTTTYCAMYLF